MISEDQCSRQEGSKTEELETGGAQALGREHDSLQEQHSKVEIQKISFSCNKELKVYKGFPSKRWSPHPVGTTSRGQRTIQPTGEEREMAKSHREVIQWVEIHIHGGEISSAVL